MTVAIDIAGGVGSRMGANIPKQFVLVEGKPVLFYTLEAFERHAEVDAIELVLIEGWEKDVNRWKEQYGICKLKWIVKGGFSGQESIRNGIFGLEGKCANDDIVVVHDGICPLVQPEVLDDVIAKARQFGTGVTSMPYNEQIFLVDEEDPAITRKYIPRETLQKGDSKALSQFIHNALEGKDIILKSEGNQRFSYLHVDDAVSGILMVMLEGRSGEAYNVADGESDVTLRELALLIARQCGRRVVFDVPDISESAGFSPAMVALMDNARLVSLGWTARYSVADGIVETIRVMKDSLHV